MGRLFTFGCSMTNYWWPTWADIYGHQREHHNWGLAGLGNLGIFLQLIEAKEKHQIGNNDEVVIMWTFLGREDRYVKDQWLAGGGVHTNRFYDDLWIKRYYCDKGSLIKELGIINAAVHVLNDLKCKWTFLSTDFLIGANAFYNEKKVDYDSILKNLKYFKDYVNEKFHVLNDFKLNTEVINVYKKTFLNIRDLSLYEFLIQEYKSETPVKLLFKDPHPTPSIFLNYIRKVFPNYIISVDCENWVLEWEEKVKKIKRADESGWQVWPRRF
jgi:hypothetical protein